MNRRDIVIAGAAVLALFVAVYTWAPFHAIDSLGQAVRNGNPDQLSALVDFPSVRQNLKDGFVAHLTKRAADDRALEKNPLIGLALMFVPVLVNSVVDSVVTPDGIIRLLSRPLGAPAGSARDFPRKKWNRSWRFIDLDHLRAEYSEADNPSIVFGLVFERRGVFTWLLVRLDLPEDEIMRRLDRMGGKSG
jgi:hypothetical protein